MNDKKFHNIYEAANELFMLQIQTHYLKFFFQF